MSKTEYDLATNSAGLIDLSSRSKIEMTGADRVKFLQNLCTNDVGKLGPGQGCEAFLLDAKGRIVDYVNILAAEDSVWLDAAPGRTEPLMQHLDRYIIREDVRLDDRTATHALLHLAGPKAAAALEASQCGDAASMKPHESRPAAITGQPCRLRCIDRTARGGYDLWVPREAADAVADALLSAEIGVEVGRIGPQTAETLRIEAGVPEFGKEIGAENLAQEMGRNDQAISFVKGCYLGQETVARLDAYGHVNKLLYGLIIDTDQNVPAGAAVVAGDKDAGAIGSSGFSHRLGKTVALAVLRRPLCMPGSKVTVAEKFAATVTELPIPTS